MALKMLYLYVVKKKSLSFLVVECLLPGATGHSDSQN